MNATDERLKDAEALHAILFWIFAIAIAVGSTAAFVIINAG
jgi:hypothetical protein